MTFGKVSLVADTTTCSNSTPGLGDVVLCDLPGLATVKVPIEATIARVDLAGAGGAAGGNSNGTWFDGGDGAGVSALLDVDSLSALRASVGAGGQALPYSANGLAPFTWYGGGGGFSSVFTEDVSVSLLAGGGGGGSGFSSDFSEIPAASRAAASTWVKTTVTGQSLAIPGATTWAVPSNSVAQGPTGGLEGASRQLGSVVSSATYDSGKGAFGGRVVQGNAIPASNGFIMMRFCAPPAPPNVTSVTPGGTQGTATVLVTATTGGDGGCLPDRFEFRTSSVTSWVSAPALSFPIIYDLVSGQSVCVQMRAHNEAGWSSESAFTCGTASITTADVAAGTGGGGALTITFTTGGTGTPTSLNVGVGGTFYIQNENPTSDFAYVRDGAQSGGTGDIHSTTTTCDSSTVAVCYLTQGLNGPYTVDALGNIFIYNPGHGPGQVVTLQ